MGETIVRTLFTGRAPSALRVVFPTSNGLESIHLLYLNVRTSEWKELRDFFQQSNMEAIFSKSKVFDSESACARDMASSPSSVI
jgi:hypothetical protein